MLNNLFTSTLSLLKFRVESLESIAKGTGLSIWWISKLLHGKIKDPSVNKIQTLHDYLSKEKV